MSEMDYEECACKLLAKMKQGLFLVTGVEKPNIMTIGWGSIGIYWAKPVFIALVRPSRYSHELIESCGEFTINIPYADAESQFNICGTVSGRDEDKFALCSYTPIPSRKVAVPIISECNLHFECRPVYYGQIEPDTLNVELEMKYYKGSDYHTLYVGEILDCYQRV
ncbi:MAG: flavin reductase family protein [Bacillota bacterium]|nr:flavin reductase family protein [Bacillota bacterium]